MFRWVKNNWGLFLILLLSIMPLLPLSHGEFFPIHDDTQVARVFEMGKALHSGMLPVRWSQDLGFGYGYPMFTFYAPLAFYVGGIIVLIGFSALVATKIVIGIGIILSGIFMYYFARSIWGDMGGVLSASAYLFAPYHALDIYVRGDVAEFWAYVFVPLAFFGLWKIYQTQKVRYVVLGAAGIAGVILSHNLTALMITPFLFGFTVLMIILSKNKLYALRFTLYALCIALAISAFYWLPVPFEIQYTNVLSQVGGTADFHNHFVCLNQLWNSPWGYGGSTAGCIDGISFALGKIYILFLLLGILISPFVLRKSKTYGSILIGSILGAGVAVFLVLPWSLPLWNAIHVLAFLQYPWRFLLIVFFFLSLVSGSLIWIVENSSIPKKHAIAGILLSSFLIILVIVQGKYFVPQKYLSVTSNDYTSQLVLTWTTSQITNEYMPKGFTKPKNSQEVAKDIFILPASDGHIVVISNNTKEKTAKVIMEKEGKLHINLAYFPGWQATVDGIKVPIFQEKAGISIFVPKGMHTVHLFYAQTLIEKIGDGVSLIGIAIVILVIIQAYL